MKRNLCSLALLLVASSGVARAEPVLCFRGAKLVDPDKQTVVPADLEVRGQVVVAIVAPGMKCDGKPIDLSGRYIVPGFIDTHVHGWGNPSPVDEKGDEEWGSLETARRILSAGVVAFLDMASEPDNWRARELARGSLRHGQIFSALMLSTGGSDERLARQRIRSQLNLNPDVIKLFAGGAQIAAMVDEAKRAKRKTVVHIASWQDAEAAVKAGASAITHFEDEAVIPAHLARLMAQKGTVSIPTLSVQCDLAESAADVAWLNDPLLLRMIGPAMLAQYRNRKAYSERANRTVRWQRNGCRPNDFRSIRILQKAGVLILAGSDTGNLGVFQGYSVHREMALLNEAGLSSWQALQAGTTAAARFLGHPVGIVAGGNATFVVLEQNPVQDIRNTTKVAMVVYRGGVVWNAGASQ
jgi:imidazolonepropionase-like amidohydrolase